MRKNVMTVFLVVLFILALAVSSVFAASPSLAMTKKTPVSEGQQEEIGKPDKGEKGNIEKGKSQERGNKPDNPGKPDQPGKPDDNDSNKPEKPEKEKTSKIIHLRGFIESMSESSLSIDTGGDTPVSVALNDETSFHIPTMGNESSVSGLQVGAEVSVKAREEEDGSLTALSVHLIPGKPTKVHRVGVVTADDREINGTITVQWKEDPANSTVFTVTEETKYLPESAGVDSLLGKRVTIISPRDVLGGAPVAKGIVVHPDSAEDIEE